MSGRVVVTGASGFVGRAVVAALLQRDIPVVAVSRTAIPEAKNLKNVRISDLNDRAGLSSACAGASAVVHLAARVHVMREREVDPLKAFRAVNVEGTRNLLAVARAEGVSRLIYMSTVKVFGGAGERPISDHDVPRPEDAYGQSKREAEMMIAADSGGTLSWTVLRPPLVYGPGVGGNFRRLLRLAGLATRIPLPLGGIPNLRSLVAVKNLADAVATLLPDVRSSGRCFLVSDGEDVSTSELLQRIARANEREARLIRCPISAMRAIGAITGRSDDVDRLIGSLRVDSTPLRDELDWRPPQSLDTALRETVVWWNSR